MMIQNRRGGFSLVEILVVSVLGALVLGAVFQTLTIQQRGTRHQNAIITTQQTNRLAMQLLDGELRELSSTGGDLIAAARDSVTFRAVRKVGIICVNDSTNSRMTVWRLGDQAFATGDSLLIFQDNNAGAMSDDAWVVRGAGTVGAPATACPSTWPGATEQGMSGLAANALRGVVTGGPVRSFERVTYALRQIAGQWTLARRGPAAGDTMVALVGPLAQPSDSGLTFAYWDTLNAAISPANLSTRLTQIGRIQIRVRSKNTGATRGTTYADSLITQINLRGN